ncbi:MAG: hypothetical protein WAM39_18485 [Bryobacteraceae bacterium]
MTENISETDPLASSKQLPSEARLRANRENAKRSKGPTSPDGKKRSSLNATRHGILSQVIHLPEEELKSYDQFTARYVADLQPVGAPELELANACADLQFRLHRLAAAEHNLFSIGHSEHGDEWETGHPESHTAFAFAETMRRSKDPLNTLSTYESRLSRRFLQTLKRLHEMQAERREREAQELEQLFQIACQHPDEIENIQPNQFGFVCSTRDWQLYFKRRVLLASRQKGIEPWRLPPFNTRDLLSRAA